MTRRTGFLAFTVVVALLVGGCVSDSQTAPDLRSSPVKSLDGSPRQLCESTMIGSEPKTICY